MARKKKDDDTPPTSTLRAVKGEKDPPKYEYKEFIIPASDAKGHSDRITVRCMSGYLRTADEMVHCRKFPYKTPSDLVRHALDRHLKWLSFLEPQIRSQLGVLDATVEIARTQQMLLKFQNTVEEVKETVMQLEKAGMKGQARKLIFDIKRRIEEEPADDVWKDKLQEEIQYRYGYLLREGTSLTEFEDDK